MTWFATRRLWLVHIYTAWLCAVTVGSGCGWCQWRNRSDVVLAGNTASLSVRGHCLTTGWEGFLCDLRSTISFLKNRLSYTQGTKAVRCTKHLTGFGVNNGFAVQHHLQKFMSVHKEDPSPPPPPFPHTHSVVESKAAYLSEISPDYCWWGREEGEGISVLLVDKHVCGLIETSLSRLWQYSKSPTWWNTPPVKRKK